ncbi:hypothetical protein CS0771_04010 [Catellatospora sp. IY07-71]|uniref:hypothetical protein n=1 Tax=Catellatospora sp. IY07-71 TaxID=2728827 RepID=UPI001BB38112|nr:hypothetical protein [Catellatospora sp. IY07-71]BCJ70857.1 hypothetical protein CS0771_04010 [Catellatospora sp. IY07-71]
MASASGPSRRAATATPIRRLLLLALLPALLATGCGRPAGDAAGPGATTAPAAAAAAFERRAAQVAQQWRDSGLTTAWREGFVPLAPLTIEPERGYPDDTTKIAASAGWYRLSTTLPKQAGNGTIAFPDGSDLPVPVVSADAAYRALAHGGQPQCDPAPAPSSTTGTDGSVSAPAGPCGVLTVTGVKLGTAQLRTSRGLATVPAWIFTVKELPDPMVRVAVAPEAVRPLPELPVSPVPQEQDFLLVATQTLDRVEERTVAYRVGVGACDKDIAPLVWESADVVVIGGSASPPDGDRACVAMLKFAPVEVTLTGPLADRVILDAVTGQPVTKTMP